MKRKFIIILILILLIIFIIWLLFLRVSPEKRPPILLTTSFGIETTDFQVHDSILFDAVDLAPRTGYEILVEREDGEVVVRSALSTDGTGRIPETVLWYGIGVRPCVKSSVVAAFTNFSEQEMIDSAIVGQNFRLTIVREGTVVRETTFRVLPEPDRPILYASDSRGCPKSGFLIGEEDVWVTGKNFSKGSLIRLWSVSASSEWKEGQALQDMTTQYYGELPSLLELKGGQTGFKKRIWPKHLESLGSYDIVAEVVTYPFGIYNPPTQARAFNIVSHMSYSGFVIQRRPGTAEPLEMDIAGSRQSPFAFRDTFLTSDDVYVGVDPHIQPALIGETARVYIVEDKTDAQWLDGTVLVDVTGFVETISVGGICGNCWATLAWTHPLTVGKYDIVLDFDMDGIYDQGTDLIDSLNPAGFTVSEVRVDSISFNSGGVGDITIYDNAEATNITAPEYVSAAHILKPSAWVKGSPQSVLVSFKAVSGINSAQIWADTGFGGLASSSSPVTVTFSGGYGQETFNVNSVPTSVGKHEIDWNWKYKNINGSGPQTEMGKTGKHTVYTTLGAPIDSMAVPWLEILDYACTWANGAATEEAVCNDVINNGFVSHYDWVGNCHRLASDFIRLIQTQGINGSLHRWGVLYSCNIHDMRTQRTKAFDPVGTVYGYGTQDWIFHQWAEANGKQRDPSAGSSLVGSWGDYEDFLYEFYKEVTNNSCDRDWVAAQPGQSIGCEAASHRDYNSNPTFYSWQGPDH